MTAKAWRELDSSQRRVTDAVGGQRGIRTIGPPVRVSVSCVHAAATTPVQQMGVLLAQNSPIRVSLPRFHYRVGLHIDLFEVCSAFTHVAACTLAQSPYS
jgi:hypothetical protein